MAKCIPVILPNGKAIRTYVVTHSQLKPMLIEQGLVSNNDFIIQVDWTNEGKFRPVFIKPMHVVCPYCGTANDIEAQDLGFEEFECGYCEGTYTIPETPEEIREANLENMKAATSGPPPSHYRIMCIGEDGTEFCLKNGVPAEYAELVCDGFQARYTEGQKCWIEPEETYADLRRMCDSDYDY